MGDEGICKHCCAMILSYLKISNENEPSIENLVPNPFSKIHPLHEWCIKARVLIKNPIKTWSNENSTGRVASVNLIDSFDNSTEISAVFFNDSIEKYEKMKKGKIYLISKAHLTENKYGTKNINIVKSSIVKLYNKRDMNDDLFNEKEKKKTVGEIEFKEYIVDSPEKTSQSFEEEDLITPNEILYKSNSLLNEEKIRDDPEMMLLDDTLSNDFIDDLETPKISKSYIDELEEIETPKVSESYIDELNDSNGDDQLTVDNFETSKLSLATNDIETPILKQQEEKQDLDDDLDDFFNSTTKYDKEDEEMVENSIRNPDESYIDELQETETPKFETAKVKEESNQQNVNNVQEMENGDDFVILIDSDSDDEEETLRKTNVEKNVEKRDNGDDFEENERKFNSDEEEIEIPKPKKIVKSSLESIFFPSIPQKKFEESNKIPVITTPSKKIGSSDGTPQKVSLKDILKKSGLKVQK